MTTTLDYDSPLHRAGVLPPELGLLPGGRAFVEERTGGYYTAGIVGVSERVFSSYGAAMEAALHLAGLPFAPANTVTAANQFSQVMGQNLFPATGIGKAGRIGIAALAWFALRR